MLAQQGTGCEHRRVMEDRFNVGFPFQTGKRDRMTVYSGTSDVDARCPW
jgi:hypothetical protein